MKESAKYEIMHVICRTVSETILIVVGYRPPLMFAPETHEFLQEIDDILTRTTSHATVLLGDLNINTADFSTSQYWQHLSDMASVQGLTDMVPNLT